MDNNTLNLINVAAAICSAIAFIYAISQGKKAKKQAELLKHIGQQAIDHANHLQQQTDKMEHINKSLSTRYIGDFSMYLKDVAELISKAKKSFNCLHITLSWNVFVFGRCRITKISSGQNTSDKIWQNNNKVRFC